MQRIRDVRQRKGWTLLRLAVEVGMSESAISLIERGKRTPRVATLRSIAAALRVSVAYLMR